MGLRRAIRRYFSTVFALDYRSLAAYRIGLGVILIADVLFRWPTIADMYTDVGVLPRPLMREVWSTLDRAGLQQWGVGSWSLHALSGQASWQYALFIAAAIFGGMVVMGMWTRWAVIASFILIVSVHNRLPFVLTSGDTHLRIVLFWTMFLPLGKIWSIDAWRRGHRGLPTSRCVVSPATAGLIVQIFILYFFSGLAKWNPLWWNGDAAGVAIHLTIYNTAWAPFLLQYPGLLRVISVATVITEVFLPWTIFCPWKNGLWRVLAALAFISMHVGIICYFTIGLFSYICITIWLAVLPGWLWDRVGIVAPMRSAQPTADPAPRNMATMPVHVFCFLMIPFMLMWNVINIRQDWVVEPIFDPHRPNIVRDYDEVDSPIFHAYEITGHALGVGQHFQMFGSPPFEDAWYVYRAKLHNGTVRDVFLDGREWPASGPLSGRDSMPNHHWRQLHCNLIDSAALIVRQRLAVFMAERWNKRHPPEEQVESLRVECYADVFWPAAIPGEARGAFIWGTYPDGPSNAFDSLLNRALQGGEPQGF